MTSPNLTNFRPVRTQFLIFTLLGEYVVQRGGTIWTSSLLELFDQLDVSERAVRSTLSRMSRKGWIMSQKHGRRSRYVITPRGRDLLEQGRQRIFEPVFSEWDGHWHLVVYSLPEGKRRTRHTLRQNLTWLGFGSLAPGTWISPWDRRQELKAALVGLDVECYVSLFSGLYLGPASAAEMVTRCWDLDALQKQYQAFLDRFQPEYEHYHLCVRRGEPIDLAESFIRNFWLVHEFQSFPLRDPNLPPVLLPPDWAGFAARDLFERYHELLGVYANQFVDQVMGVSAPYPADEPLPVGAVSGER